MIAQLIVLAIGWSGVAPRSQVVRLQHSVRLQHAVRMSEPPLTITGNNIELTESLREYVKEKVGGVISKFGSSLVSSCDTHLSVIKNPSVSQSDTCEVVVISKGLVIRAAERTESMYTSIDLVAGKLSRKLRKLKERKQGSKASLLAPPLPDLIDDDLIEPEPVEASAAKIVRRKQFQMPPQSLEDAIVCLEYIEHPFYVFKSSETGEINVLYKRNSGGLGLIEPEK